MKCPSCGCDNREGAKFCGECAAPLATLACPSCGTANPKGRKFCGSCGQPLAEPSAPDPRSYTPKHLVEKILTSRSALEGERKQVTVLFADVKGSIDLAEQVDPEELAQDY
jgi:Double zinc ribbon